MKKLITFSIFVFLLAFLSGTMFAQVGTGKLAGKIVDAETGEPLIGANVVIMNTSLGAAADLDGEYFILNITPGTYDIQLSFVGYGSKLIKDIRVVAGITYELNSALSPGIAMEEIVVTDKKFFEEKSTNTVKVIDSEEILKLPIKGITKIAALESGVVMNEGSGGAEGNATINVRGGRGSEVLYIVDGIPQNDIFTGTNSSQVSDAAIDQLSFQIGGYEAKYGQAQSGIINITTKSGSPTYSIYADVVSSEFTDVYGYNEYTTTLSGPIVPGNGQHTFFVSAERGWFKDADPRAIGLNFESIGKKSDIKPDNEAGIWRVAGRTKHNVGTFNLSFGANVNLRDYRGYVHSYAKNNSMHNTWNEDMNATFSGKVSQNIGSNSFWNINVGYRLFTTESGDGVWKDNLFAYGDEAENLKRGWILPNGNGSRISFDEYGIFALEGRQWNAYSKGETATMNLDLDFTSQIDNHLVEIGGGFYYNSISQYSIAPINLAANSIRILPTEERFKRLRPTYYGYDVMGNKADGEGMSAVKHPVITYGYVQDRFELDDIVLNVGVRFDYYDPATDIIKDPLLPYAAGDPNNFDEADFIKKEAEFNISPRIGIGFPVTETTVFHAQFGKFIQPPTLNQVYTGLEDMNDIQRDDGLTMNNGGVESEITTQYEVGFRQVLGDIAALNITAFYKNTEGLVNLSNVLFQRSDGGETLRYFTPTNQDFGTVKGLALSLDVTRISYFNLSVDYTFALAEGTGSSTSSSFVATFRNDAGEVPKVIAPLDFDQRHTGVANLDFFIPKGELGVFELVSANLLFSFNSGRPYTPLYKQDLLSGNTNYGDTKGYVNSAYGPGTFRVDVKLQKTVDLGNLSLTPYLWIENLFDTVNEIDVYRSTGSAYTTAYLDTDEAKVLVKANGQGWAQDYEALERNPFNFGVSRQIRLGLKVNFGNISL
ncbi:MAG: TonB-dependent receptor [Bacteroidetes bacterium]|nr:TonB-dependent receptor [Bacteroidota bacterium]MBU1677579.1 TonB-dependent receptor [Bacteroidota bacterium]